MTSIPATVLLTFDSRQKIPAADAWKCNLPAARYRKWSESSTVYAIECPVDHERLTDRAKALLASGWRGTFRSGDDLADTPLVKRRRASSVIDAVEPLLRHAGIDPASDRGKKIRQRANGVAACYGDLAGEMVEPFEDSIGAAPIAAIDDATDYVNALAAADGIAALGDQPIDVGAAPWSFVLLGREIGPREWSIFQAGESGQ